MKIRAVFDRLRQKPPQKRSSSLNSGSKDRHLELSAQPPYIMDTGQHLAANGDRAMFIQTEETPNPATMKFLPGREVMPAGTLEITDAKGAASSPLAEALFAIEGVSGVFLAREFITVTKTGGKEWPTLKPPILSTIMDHFTHNRPVIAGEGSDPAQVTHPEDDELSKQIREIIDTKVRPAVAQDGGDITFQSFDDGVVYLHLKGSCAGCPSSTLTLKAGIENMLKHYVPEVKEVRQIR